MTRDDVDIAVATSGLPTPAANGSVSMTLHQVNGDGAGYVAHFLPHTGVEVPTQLTFSLHF